MDILKFCSVGAVLLVGLFLAINGLAFHSKEVACATWGQGTGRETKFVSSYPWYSDCLVNLKSGWISAYVMKAVETPNITN